MTDPIPYLESIIFEVEWKPKNELFSHIAVYYHETKESIKQLIQTLEVRNGWECVSVHYKKVRDGIRREL